MGHYLHHYVCVWVEGEPARRRRQRADCRALLSDTALSAGVPSESIGVRCDSWQRISSPKVSLLVLPSGSKQYSLFQHKGALTEKILIHSAPRMTILNPPISLRQMLFFGFSVSSYSNPVFSFGRLRSSPNPPRADHQKNQHMTSPLSLGRFSPLSGSRWSFM